MQLSKAAQIGSTLTSQAFNVYYETGTVTQNERTCFFGSALVGINKLDRGNYIFANIFNVAMILATWPWIMEKHKIRLHCPVIDCRVLFTHFFSLFVHLNDDHCWSRLRIANYVGLFEPKEVEAPSVENQLCIL